MKKTIFFLNLLAVLGLLMISPALSAEMSLTSDQLEYNPEQEKVFASGNVHFSRNGLDIYSERCEGAIDGSYALFWDKLKGEGTLEGESLRFSADFLEARFGEDPYYAFKGKVDAVFGSKELKADMVELSGDVLNAENLEHFRDEVSGISVSGDHFHGRMEKGLILEFTITQKVRILLSDGTGKETLVQGQKAIYSKERGSLVVSGNARAVQGNRKITAENLVVFPESDRIEAKGNPRITFSIRDQDKN